MFSNTRCCLNLARSALVAANSTVLARIQSDKLVRPLISQAILQRRLRHDKYEDESPFDIFEKPKDPSRVQIDEALKGLGERGIKRDGRQVSSEDMFKLFQLERKFLINEGKLHREMLRMQRALHPDKFLDADRTSLHASGDLSALINEAYRTLKNPYKRALYLIRLKAGKSESEVEKSLDKLEMDPKFLARMMEIREKIDGRQGGKGEQMKLAQELQSELDEIVLSVNRDFECDDFKSALRKLGKLKFVANCHEAVNDKWSSFDRF